MKVNENRKLVKSSGGGAGIVKPTLSTAERVRASIMQVSRRNSNHSKTSNMKIFP